MSARRREAPKFRDDLRRALLAAQTRRLGLRGGRGNQRKQLTVDRLQASITAKSLCIGVSMLRHVICWIMIALIPAALLATDTDSGAAMLYGKGTVWLNGKPLPRSSAIFPGDLIQTQPESVATLDSAGSGVIVYPDSLVKFEGNAVSLESGSVSVATSKGMVALAREVTATPASNAWTEFQVAETEETVKVFASKGDVNVNCGKETANLSAGDEVTADKSGKCKKKKKGAGMPPAGDDHILTNPFVLGSIAVGGGVIVCLLLCDAPKPFLSPWKP